MTEISPSLSVNNSYSQALYELVEEEKSIDQVEKEATAILKLIIESTEFVNLIKDPRNTQSEQTNALSAICERYELNNTLIKFLNFLISKRRLFFRKNFERFFKYLFLKKRWNYAKLTAAKELSTSELDNIKNSLKENFGSNLKLKFKYDPSLLGGLIVQVGSIMIDTSIKNKLQQIENKMIEA